MILSQTSAERVLLLSDILTAESQQLLLSLPKPNKVLDVTLPDNLDDLTIGELFKFQQSAQGGNMVDVIGCCAEVLLGRPIEKVLAHRADNVIGMVLWVSQEVQRIGDLFRKVQAPPTPEAVQAGVDKLNFGAFGIVDWFANRQHISDHDKVMNVPWVRVLECMRIDNERSQFEQRLRDVLMSKHKHKSK